MVLTRFSPFAPAMWNQFDQLQSEVNRLFQRYDRAEPAVFPPLNVWEQDDVYHVEAELPGVELADLDITVTGPNQLTIKGQRKPAAPEGGAAHRQERVFGAFARTVTMPVQIDADKVDARFENGVLKLALPKHEAAKPRKIIVK